MLFVTRIYDSITGLDIKSLRVPLGSITVNIKCEVYNSEDNSKLNLRVSELYNLYLSNNVYGTSETKVNGTLKSSGTEFNVYVFTPEAYSLKNYLKPMLRKRLVDKVEDIYSHYIEYPQERIELCDDYLVYLLSHRLASVWQLLYDGLITNSNIVRRGNLVLLRLFDCKDNFRVVSTHALAFKITDNKLDSYLAKTILGI